MAASGAMQAFAAMFQGYSRALERFDGAVTGRDAVEAFIPLFEALNWTVVLDDRTAKHWAPETKVLGWRWRQRGPGASVIGGVRFARNRTHYQWADALVLEGPGRQYPKSYWTAPLGR